MTLHCLVIGIVKLPTSIKYTQDTQVRLNLDSARSSTPGLLFSAVTYLPNHGNRTMNHVEESTPFANQASSSTSGNNSSSKSLVQDALEANKRLQLILAQRAEQLEAKLKEVDQLLVRLYALQVDLNRNLDS